MKALNGEHLSVLVWGKNYREKDRHGTRLIKGDTETTKTFS